MYELRLRTTSVPIHSLIEKIDRGELRLPEIQRDYVWKPAQVAGLLDSIYRRYPSGSILTWETNDDIEERRAKIEGSGAAPLVGRPQYLLDGQQRITSLHRAFHDHPDAQVVFNVKTEKFQIQSAATTKDPRWVKVHSILVEKDLFAFVQSLAERIEGLDRSVTAKRLQKVQAIGDYGYYVEIVENLPYEEVTEIFIRVNSRGRALKTTDLALATLSARWRGVISLLEAERDRYSHTFPAIDLAFLARSIAAIGTEQRQLSGFVSTSESDLKNAWERTTRGLEHLLPLLANNAGIETSQLVPSANALVPLVAYLGTRPDAPLSREEANGLLYWLFAAFITGRYNQSGDTRIAQDALAIKAADPLPALYQNLGLHGSRPDITESALAGKGAGSPYFLLSYLAARRAGATDWYYGVGIGLDATGGRGIEYHHIHPQATLKKRYSKVEINDLANLAFISGRANRKISDRSPSTYFPEVGDLELGRHFVPLNPTLRTEASFPEFVRQRRQLLAEAMTTFMDSFRPAFLDAAPAVEQARAELVVDVGRDGDSRLLTFRARNDGATWTGSARLDDLLRFLADIEDSLTGQLPVGGELVTVEGGADVIDVPIGPLIVSGRLDEWRAMIERELAEESDEPSVVPEVSPPWTGERTSVSVVVAE